jgi:hypothetical protein
MPFSERYSWAWAREISIILWAYLAEHPRAKRKEGAIALLGLKEELGKSLCAFCAVSTRLEGDCSHCPGRGDTAFGCGDGAYADWTRATTPIGRAHAARRLLAVIKRVRDDGTLAPDPAKESVQ